MNDIHLKLTVDEVNVIFEALGQQPFAKVYELIGKINEQADEQLKGLNLNQNNNNDSTNNTIETDE